MTITRSMLGFKIIKLKIGLKLSHRYCHLLNVINPNPTVRFETIIAKLQLGFKLSGRYCKLGQRVNLLLKYIKVNAQHVHLVKHKTA